MNKVKKLICDIEDKKKYVIHIRALKQGLNRGLRLKIVHRIIQFKQRAWLKVYIDMKTELRKNVKNEFEKFFFDHLMVIEMKKTRIKMKKTIISRHVNI